MTSISLFTCYVAVSSNEDSARNFTPDEIDELVRRFNQRKNPYIFDYPHNHPTSDASFNRIFGWIQLYIVQLFLPHGTIVSGICAHPNKAVRELYPKTDETIRNRLIAGLTTIPVTPAGLVYISRLVEEVDLQRKLASGVLEPVSGTSGGSLEGGSVAAASSTNEQSRFASIDGPKPWPFLNLKQELVPLLRTVFSNDWATKRTFSDSHCKSLGNCQIDLLFRTPIPLCFFVPPRVDGVTQDGVYTSNATKLSGASKIVEALSKLADADVCLALHQSGNGADKAAKIFPGMSQLVANPMMTCVRMSDFATAYVGHYSVLATPRI